MNPEAMKRCLSCLIVIAMTIGLLALPALGAPKNDNSANATVVSNIPFVDQQNTSGATMELNEAQACPGATIGATVWYKWVPRFNTGVWADTFGSNFDTIITVLEDRGGSFPTMACNDNATYGGAIYSKTSQVNFSAIGGHVYYFEVGGSQGATGELKFSIGKLPTNDNLLDARPIPAPFTEVTTNFGATMEMTETPGCTGQTGTLWYKYTPVSSTPVSFETSGSNFDTTVAVWEWADADFGGILSGPTSFNFVGCSDDTADKTSRLTWVAKGFDSSTGPRSYFIQVGGKAGTRGFLRYSLSTVALPSIPQVLPPTSPPPITPVTDPLPGFTPPNPGGVPPLPNPPGTVPGNDMFAAAMTLSSSPTAVTQSTVGTTTESSEPLTSCEVAMKSTVWYSYKPTANQSLFLDATASSFPPVVAVYKQSGSGFSGLQLIGCANASTLSRAVFTWQGLKNVLYYIQLGGAADAAANSGISTLVLGRFI